jgi:hypothetical protein
MSVSPWDMLQGLSGINFQRLRHLGGKIKHRKTAVGLKMDATLSAFLGVG